MYFNHFVYYFYFPAIVKINFMKSDFSPEKVQVKTLKYFLSSKHEQSVHFMILEIT
ncbi:hypothetical protein THOD04_30455 [Vibrio owensii]|nr:hypothetical protein THOD04_30455 [Vibrio owensii]